MSSTPGTDVGRIKELLQQALDREGADREEFLDELRDKDSGAHQRVLQLLGAWSRSEGMESVTLPHVRSAESYRDPLARVGEQIGQYEILEILGEGGAGVVYRARQLGIDRTVAIKVLRAGRFATNEEVRRFRAEAEMVARLDHPAIVPVHEVGEQQGRHYFTMKLIEGESLATSVPRFQGDHRAAAALLAEVARAVQHGHERGILHRDLKPSNVLLDAQGRPFVADFGVAKRTDGDHTLTRSGWLAGTPSYMAPEQFGGEGAEATVRIDVYGLGCILFELLTGRPPFSGSSPGEIMQRIWSEQPRFLPQEQAVIPKDLRTICLRCLEKEPARRYHSAEAVSDELERWLAGEPIVARTVSLPERVWLHWKRKPLVTSLLAGVILLATALLVGVSVASVVLNAGLRRAVEAEDEARGLLRSSYLATARATRRTTVVGRRFESLRLLQEAAAIEPGPDLRDEAVACLALADVRVDRVHGLPGERPRIAALDPVLERYAVGLPDNSVRLANMLDGAEIERFEIGPGRPWYLRFSPDGRYLAAKAHGRRQYDDPRFVVWDLHARRTVVDRPLVVWGRSMDFHPTDPQVAVGQMKGEIQIIDLLDPSEEARVESSGVPHSLKYSPDGRTLAVILDEGRVELLSTLDLVRQRVLEHPAHAYSLGWSADGGRLAVGCGDGYAYLWDASSGETLRTLEGHKAEVVHARFLADDRYIVTDAWDGTMRLFEIQTGEQLLQTPWAVAEVMPDREQLAFFHVDQIGLATVFHGDVLRIFRGHTVKGPSAVAVDLDGRLLATGASDGILLWEMQSGSVRSLWDGGAAPSLAFHPRTGELHAATNRGILAWPMPPEESEPRVLFEGNCQDLSFTSDGERLAFRIGRSLHVMPSDASTQGIVIHTPSGASGSMISPDGELIAAGAWRGRGVGVWSARSGAHHRLLQQDDTAVGVAFSPDSRWLATGSSSTYRLLRCDDWEPVWELPRPGPHHDLPGAMTFSRDGRLLAVSLDRQRVQVVDVGTGRPLATLEAPEADPLTELGFAPDGDTLVAGSTANRIQVWNLASLWRNLDELGLGGSAEGD